MGRRAFGDDLRAAIQEFAARTGVAKSAMTILRARLYAMKIK